MNWLHHKPSELWARQTEERRKRERRLARLESLEKALAEARLTAEPDEGPSAARRAKGGEVQ